jgi:hypothetical protein
MEYTVEKDTLAIVFPEQGLWTKDRARVHKTRFTNTFSESEVVIHPNRTPDELPSDESVVRAAYGVMGYFGFQRSGETMVLLVPCEDVWILTDKGFTKEEIKSESHCQNRNGDQRPGSAPGCSDPPGRGAGNGPGQLPMVWPVDG